MKFENLNHQQKNQLKIKFLNEIIHGGTGISPYEKNHADQYVTEKEIKEEYGQINFTKEFFTKEFTI